MREIERLKTPQTSIVLPVTLTPLVELYVRLTLILRNFPSSAEIMRTLRSLFEHRYRKLFAILNERATLQDKANAESRNKAARKKFMEFLQANPEMCSFVCFKPVYESVQKDRILDLEKRLYEHFLRNFFSINSLEEIYQEINLIFTQNFYEKVDESLLVKIANDRNDKLRWIARDALQTGDLKLPNAIALFERMMQ